MKIAGGVGGGAEGAACEKCRGLDAVQIELSVPHVV